MNPIEIGIDSFAAAYDETSLAVSASDRLRNLVEQIEHADQVGLDSFGIGEHHRAEYLDSAPTVILGAAAARTSRIRLTCRNGPQRGRPGAGIPELRHTGFGVAGPGGDRGRPRLVHRVLPAVRPPARGLRLAVCREPRPPSQDP